MYHHIYGQTVDFNTDISSILLYQSTFYLNSMNKRCQSQKVMTKKDKYQRLPRRECDEKAKQERKQQIIRENTLLHQKINASKEILETIYDKVKKKQTQYEQKLVVAKDRCSQLQQIGKKYKDFGEEQLRVFHTNSIIQKYSGHSNYRHDLINDQNNSSVVNQAQNQDNMKGAKTSGTLYRSESMNIKTIVSEYKQKQSQNEKNGPNIYEMYLNRVNQNQRTSILARNNQQETVISKVRRLSKEIEEDIEDLKLNKNYSANNLKIKPVLTTKSNKMVKDKKSYFLEIQKRKLKIL